MLVELLRGRDRCQDLPGALLDAPFAGGVHVTSRAAGCQCHIGLLASDPGETIFYRRPVAPVTPLSVPHASSIRILSTCNVPDS